MTFRPNIVVILSEDLSPHSASYGDPLSPMKTVDAIAQNALVYENAYCTVPVCAPSRFSMLTGMEPASVGPAQQMRADGVVPESYELLTTPLRKVGYYCINVGKSDYNFDAKMGKLWDDFSMDASWRNRAEGQPFLAFFNLVETHESALFREPVTIVAPEAVNIPPYLPDTPEIREDFARYYTAMSKSEAHMAKIMSQLVEDGLLESTVIIQFSDHGGSEPRSKRFVYDSGNRIPLIIKMPDAMREERIWRTPERISTAVSLIDFAPTVCDIAGVEKPGTMIGSSLLGVAKSEPERVVFTGRDRMDENYDLIRTARTSQYLYIRNYFPNRPWLQYQAYAWQAKGFQSWEREHLAGRTSELQSRYFGRKPAEEFYDSKADPHQVNNLIDSAEHQGVIDNFRAQLDLRTIEIFDNGFIPEGTAAEGIASSRNPSLYPIEEVLKIAKLSTMRAAANLGTFVELLSHENEVLRFWAAQGLLNLAEAAEPAIDDVLAGLQDPSDHVRTVLAELAAILGHRDVVEKVFSELLISSKPFQVLIRATRAAVYVTPPLVGLAQQVDQLVSELRSPKFDDPGYFNAYTGLLYLKAVLAGNYQPESKLFDETLFLERLAKSNPGMVASMQASRR